MVLLKIILSHFACLVFTGLVLLLLFLINMVTCQRISFFSLQVNETFLFYINITSYARQWMNVSDEVRRKSSSVSDVSGNILNISECKANLGGI